MDNNCLPMKDSVIAESCFTVDGKTVAMAAAESNNCLPMKDSVIAESSFIVDGKTVAMAAAENNNCLPMKDSVLAESCFTVDGKTVAMAAAENNNCLPMKDSVLAESCFTVDGKTVAMAATDSNNCLPTKDSMIAESCFAVDSKTLAMAAAESKTLSMRMDDHLIWCDNMKETLIKEFCQSECLWNPKDKNYRCHRWKKVVMTQIARKMSIIYGVRITENELLRQWNMLRDQFRRAKRTGKDQWRFYEHLLFLDSVDFNKDSSYWTDTSLSISSIYEASQAQMSHSYSHPNTPFHEISLTMKDECADTKPTLTATATVSTISLASALESLQALARDNVETIEPNSETDRLSDTQSEGKSTITERKRPLDSPSTNDLFTLDIQPPGKRTMDNSNLLAQQLLLPKMEADDQFTHFARTVETKLRFIYQVSPVDGVRLQKRISDAIFEKEMEFIERSVAFSGVHNLFS